VDFVLSHKKLNEAQVSSGEVLLYRPTFSYRSIGTKNLVIAASPEGILVSDKESSSRLKTYVDKLDQRPMYEERRWGEYKVLDDVVYEDGIVSLTKHLKIKAGKFISYHIMPLEMKTGLSWTAPAIC